MSHGERRAARVRELEALQAVCDKLLVERQIRVIGRQTSATPQHRALDAASLVAEFRFHAADPWRSKHAKRTPQSVRQVKASRTTQSQAALRLWAVTNRRSTFSSSRRAKPQWLLTPENEPAMGS